MIVLYGSPVFLSAVMIAAHFYRSSLVILALFCLLSPLVLLLKSPWVPKFMTALLVLFALEWLRIMVSFIHQYKLQEIPYIKLVMILSSVILFTLFSSAIFRTKAMKKRYHGDDEGIWFIR
jgi:hypothetical protein